MNATPQSTSISPFSVPFLAVPRKRGDEACATLSPMAFKVFYYIDRMTWGWQREEAAISYNEFKNACGIKDSHTISAAIKELVSKGFIRAVKHVGEKGRRFTSSYSLLLGDPAGTTPAPLQHRAPKQEKAVELLQQATGTSPVGCMVAPSTSPGGIPPAAPPRQSAPQASPDQAIETPKYRAIHTLIDTVELPCFQESQAGEEEEEARGEEEKERGEVESRAETCPRSREEEVRACLEELALEYTQAYCRMVKSEYGTREYQESRQKLATIRADQKRLRALMDRQEAS